MKELSMEAKAKRYSEAIERAKGVIEQNPLMEYLKKAVEYIFPELKESEDERIRKEMIFYFQEEIPQCSIQEHSDKMREFISWLKRQEIECIKLELKAGNSYFCYKSRWERADNETFKKGLIYKCNKDGVLDNFVIKNPEQYFIEIKDERIAWLEKQGKNNMGISEATKQKLDDNLNKSLEKETHESWDKFLDEQGEQKPAWSEEDKPEDYKDLIKQLQSLMSEWSNKKDNMGICINKHLQKIVSSIKSLKERYTWKPNDEQIIALRWVLNNIPYNKHKEEISGMLEQLKKLKG